MGGGWGQALGSGGDGNGDGGSGGDGGNGGDGFPCAAPPLPSLDGPPPATAGATAAALW